MRSTFALFIAVFLTLAVTNDSSAQIPEAVYEDLQKVIEELIVQEVAENAVPRLVCSAGRVTIPEDCSQDTSDGCSDIYGKDDFTHVTLGKQGSKAKYGLVALAYYPRTLHRIYSQQFGALRSSVVDETSTLAGYLLLRGLKDARLTAAPPPAPAAALPGPGAAPVAAPPGAPVLKLPTEAALLTGSAATPNDSGHGFQQLSEESYDDCTEQVREKFNDFRAREDILSTACIEPDDATEALHCELALSVRAALQGQETEAEYHLQLALAWILTDAMTVSAHALAGKDLQPHRQLLFEKATFALQAFIRDHDETAFLGVLESALRSLPELQTAVGIADRLKPIGDTIGRFRSQWLLLSNGGRRSVTFGAVANVMASSSGALRALIDAYDTVEPWKTDPSAQALVLRLTKMTKLIGAADQLRPLIVAAGRADLRELAHRGMSVLFEQEGGKPCSDHDTCPAYLYRRFAESVFVYVADGVENPVPSQEARAAFRAAAKDVIRSIGAPGGVTRAGWRAFVLPDLGLRMSWSPNYFNNSTDGRRVTPFVTGPTIRWPFLYTQYSYTALYVSFFDMLAPLSELASRDSDADFDASGKLWANALAPRLDVVTGLPAISERLLVGAGASLRLAVPFRLTDGSCGSADGTCYEYRYGWEVPFMGKSDSQFARFLEFGLNVRYVL